MTHESHFVQQIAEDTNNPTNNPINSPTNYPIGNTNKGSINTDH